MNISVSMSSEVLSDVFGIHITNSMVGGLLVSLVIILILLLLGKPSYIPTRRIQTLMEYMIEVVWEFFERIFGDIVMARRFAPFLLTVFLFVIISNFVLYIPFVISLTYQSHEGIVPFIREPTADTSFTLGFTFCLVLVSNLMGFAKSPFGKFFSFVRINKILEVRSFIGAFNFAVEMILGLLELIGEFARVMSMGFRLFGNIFGEGVLLIVITEISKDLIPHIPILIAPFPFLLLITFTGIVQACVYTILSALAIKSGLAYHH